MARSTRDDLFDRLRTGGLRKKVAKNVADGLHGGRRGSSKSVNGVLDQLKALTTEIEDRAKGGAAKRKAAGRKAAVTRERNAAKRRTAAKKGARTRAKGR